MTGPPWLDIALALAIPATTILVILYAITVGPLSAEASGEAPLCGPRPGEPGHDRREWRRQAYFMWDFGIGSAIGLALFSYADHLLYGAPFPMPGTVWMFAAALALATLGRHTLDTCPPDPPR